MADRRVTRSMTGALTPHQRQITDNIQNIQRQIDEVRVLARRARSTRNRETHEATIARLERELLTAMDSLAQDNTAAGVPIVLTRTQQLAQQDIQVLEDNIANLEVSLIGMIDQVEIARIQARLSVLNNQLLRARQSTATQPNVLLQTYISEIQRYQGLLANQSNRFVALIIETRLNALRYQLSRISDALNIRRAPRRQRIPNPVINRHMRELEQRISSIYAFNNDLSILNNVIHNFANVQLYFTDNGILANTIYRKLELTYKESIYEKFNEIKDNVIGGILDETLDLSMGMQYFNEIYQYYVNILEQLNLLVQPRKINLMLIRETEFKISNEKIIIHNILHTIHEIKDRLNPDNQAEAIEISNLDRIKTRLDDRVNKLNEITREILEGIFTSETYTNKRNYVISILKSARILMRTFLYCMVSIYYSNDTVIPLIREKMNESLTLFLQIINIDTSVADITTQIDERNTLQLNITDTIYNTLVRGSDNRVTTFNNIFAQQTGRNITQNNIDRYILDSIKLNIEFERINNRTSNFWNLQQSYTIQQRREARIAAQQTRINEREVRRASRISARIQAREERARLRRERQEERARLRAQAREERRRNQSARRIPRAPTVRAPIILPHQPVTTVENANIEFEFEQRFEVSTIDEQYKGPGKFIDKLLEKCKEYSLYFQNEGLRDNYYKELTKEFKTSFNDDEPVANVYGSIINIVGNSIASLFSRYILNDEDMKFNDLPRYYVANFSLIIEDMPTPSNPNKKKYTFERQSGIDVGGLRRDFISALTTELFDKKIFITRDGTNKYFLNPEYKPDDDETFKEVFKYISRSQPGVYSSILHNGIYNKFYRFLGELMGFIYVNDCGIVNNLSSYLIANFVKNTIHDYDYVYYLIEDFPEYSKSIINLMKDKETIEYIGIEYNDTYDLETAPNNVSLTKDNIEDFIVKTAKYMMTKTILRKDIDVLQPDVNDKYKKLVEYGEEITSIFIDGIPEHIVQYNINMNFTSRIVTSFLVPPTMNADILTKLIENFKRTMSIVYQDLRPIQKNKFIILSNAFEAILKLPTEAERNPEAASNHFKFIEKLIKFWSGSIFYKEKEKYKIKINEGLGAEYLPQSHTCFFQIDFPDYSPMNGGFNNGVPSPAIITKMRSKLELAVSNVEDGIGMAGGGNKRRRRRQRH